MSNAAAFDRWHRFVAEGDPVILESVLADDVVFSAPTYWTPRSGKAVVMFILMAVTELLEDFAYQRQWVDGPDWALEFSARIDGLSLKGIDLVRLNEDGRIATLEVMIRPPNAVAALRERMERKFLELQAPAD